MYIDKQIAADPLQIQKQIFLIMWVLSCIRLEISYEEFFRSTPITRDWKVSIMR